VRDRRTPARAAPKPPTLIVVGEVVRLRSRLAVAQSADSLVLVA